MKRLTTAIAAMVATVGLTGCVETSDRFDTNKVCKAFLEEATAYMEEVSQQHFLGQDDDDQDLIVIEANKNKMLISIRFLGLHPVSQYTCFLAGEGKTGIRAIEDGGETETELLFSSPKEVRAHFEAIRDERFENPFPVQPEYNYEYEYNYEDYDSLGV